jgi:uncharacterized protein (DUF362 family)
VALARRETRYATVSAALAGVRAGIDLSRAQHVLVKPNFVNTQRQIASTHVDAVRAVLEVVRATCTGRVTIGEGPAASPASVAFVNFGYEEVAREYDAELLDLNADDTVPIKVYDHQMRPMTLYYARTVRDADFRISVGPPKTHDTVVVTLSIKNLAMGALVNPTAAQETGRALRITDDLIRSVPVWLQHSKLAEIAKRYIARPPRGSSKLAMHQSIPAINLNLALVAAEVWPDLAVIDGWCGMEGAGPSMGDPVDWGIALAGTDPLAVDVLAAHLMGFDPAAVGYLVLCQRLGLGIGDLAAIDVIGDAAPADVRRAFKPHPTVARQLAWQSDGVNERLPSRWQPVPAR